MSTTENTRNDDAAGEEVDGVVEAGNELEVMDPASGELINLRELTTDRLAAAVARVDAHIVAVADFRKALVAEGARRLDGLAQRKATIGRYELETNAPSAVEYREHVLREAIEELIAADVLEEGILEQLWPTPAPSPPPVPKLDKRVVNKLKRDPRVAPSIARAAVNVNANRTLKVREVDHG